jgi:Domain of unknown function (DUF4266)
MKTVYILLKIFDSPKIVYMDKKTLSRCLSAIASAALLASCQSVKEYQKSRINDSEMTLNNRKIEKEELNMESYREGSSGANGGKTGGGCGCN